MTTYHERFIPQLLAACRRGEPVMSSVRAQSPTPPASDECTRPHVSAGCFRCGVDLADVHADRVIVSPTGTGHFGEVGGKTRCGIDATGDLWWWPL